MVRKLDVLHCPVLNNHGTIPVYIDETLVIRDRKVSPYIWCDESIILSPEVFYQYYKIEVPSDIKYIIVLRNEYTKNFHLLELKILLDEYYNDFLEYREMFELKYDPDSHSLYRPTQIFTASKLETFRKVRNQIDERVVEFYGENDWYGSLLHSTLLSVDFISNNNYSIHHEERSYGAKYLIENMIRRFDYISKGRYMNISKLFPVTHMKPGIAMDYAVADHLNLEIKIEQTGIFSVNFGKDPSVINGFICFQDFHGNHWGRFNPSMNSLHAEYAINKYFHYILHEYPKEIEIITPEKIRSWPIWNYTFSDVQLLNRYIICSTILMNQADVDDIQHIKMVKIPKILAGSY